MKKYRVSAWDVIKGALIGAGGAVLKGAYNAVYDGLINHQPINLSVKDLSLTAAGGLLAYLSHKFLTDDLKVAQKRIEKAGGTVTPADVKLPIQ